MHQRRTFKITPSEDSPEVLFNQEKGKLYIQGASFSDKTFEIFDKLINWAKDYLTDPIPKTEIHIRLSIFNSQTEKFLINLLSLFEESDKTQTTVYWYYFSPDDLETGMEYTSLINLNFNFIKENRHETS